MDMRRVSALLLGVILFVMALVFYILMSTQA